MKANPTEQFRDAIIATGLTAPDAIEGDGTLRRFASNGRVGDDAGWYVLHLDGIPAGIFGDWRTGYSENWCAKAEDDLSHAERQAMRERIQAAHAMREAEQSRRHDEAAWTALALWEAYEPAVTHPYLSAKGIQPHGARIDGLRLVIPARDTTGKLHSLQTINADGNKRFMPGGRVRGCYFPIGRPAGTLIVCEGYATGASIHEATGQAVAVAFNAGNLEPAALALHRKYPGLTIVIAADDDWRTDGNPGLSCAKSAALAVGGFTVVPQFPAGRPAKATDFNDLAALAGLDAVRVCFSEIVGFVC